MVDDKLEAKAENSEPVGVKGVEGDLVIRKFETLLEKFPEEVRPTIYAIADLFYQKGVVHGLGTGAAVAANGDDISQSSDSEELLFKKINQYCDYLEQKSGIPINPTERYYYLEINRFLTSVTHNLEDIMRFGRR